MEIGFKPRSILITGGTGSLGHQLVADLLERYPDLERLVIFSRDELKQYEMAQVFSGEKHRCVRFFLGDVRDRDRLVRALQGIDVVIHAAALKQVPAAEYNPMEFIKTNVLGAENVIEAAIDAGVKKVVALSTDKACAPVNLYGATKLCSDKLFVAANNYAGGYGITFSVVRYGNVMGSRGSVIPFFLKEKKSGVLPITDPEMTRFNITLKDGVRLVTKAMEHSLGGEIFVPKIPSYRITDVAEAIGPECEKPVVGVRPGEKIHEEMITDADACATVDLGDGYVILPAARETLMAGYVSKLDGKLVPPGFRYNSGTNSEWLSVEEIRELIIAHVDSSFAT
tara:strand:+ start:2483 stop:3502 length:1020 start_codon:yes stop_codon:yes gene_type:complete